MLHFNLILPISKKTKLSQVDTPKKNQTSSDQKILEEGKSSSTNSPTLPRDIPGNYGRFIPGNNKIYIIDYKRKEFEKSKKTSSFFFKNKNRIAGVLYVVRHTDGKKNSKLHITIKWPERYQELVERGGAQDWVCFPDNEILLNAKAGWHNQSSYSRKRKPPNVLNANCFGELCYYIQALEEHCQQLLNPSRRFSTSSFQEENESDEQSNKGDSEEKISVDNDTSKDSPSLIFPFYSAM